MSGQVARWIRKSRVPNQCLLFQQSSKDERQLGLSFSTPFFQLIVLSGHIAAATMLFLARRETTMSGDPTGCWLGAGSFGGSPNWQEWPILKKYVVTFYWSIMTLTSIGYGDLLPVTVLERAFVALYGVWSMGLVRRSHYYTAI
jgi:hypothetical protein